MLQCGLILIGDGVIFLALDMGDISLVRALSATVCVDVNWRWCYPCCT